MLLSFQAKRRTLALMVALTAWATSLASSASAHFIWLHVEAGPEGPIVHVRFSEDAATNEPGLLDRLSGMQLRQCQGGEACYPLTPVRRHDTLVAPLATHSINGTIIVGTHDLGVMTRGEATFRLLYAAKTGPELGATAWQEAPVKGSLDFDVVPSLIDGQVQVLALWKGEPVADAQVVAYCSDGVEVTGSTDATGTFRFKPTSAGTASIRVRHIDATAGEVDGKAFGETRYYTTVALPITRTQVDPASVADLELPRLPQVVTSFGAAMVDGQLYVYGGHIGEAHEYIKGDQEGTLRRLNVAEFEQTGQAQWEELAQSTPLQGLALVPHGSSVIRVGGFNAHNTEPEPQDLHSTNEVYRYSPDTNDWTAMTPLPEARSSHDAIVLGGKLYVVGGWQMAGPGNTVWHKTAWSLELDKPEAQWEALPDVPFVRRAMALAAHEGKLYVIGGMEEQGGPTTKVSCFDPATQTWSEIEALPGKGMSGFGCAAFSTGGDLYVSTINGELLKLTDEGTWSIEQKLPRSRFFHRMLPMDAQRLLVVGGGNMESGKFDQVDVVRVTK